MRLVCNVAAVSLMLFCVARAALADDPAAQPVLHQLHPQADVVLISGDGGWGQIETDLAAGFRSQRMSVTTIDSSVQFARYHSVRHIAEDIEKTLDTQRPLVLVGYSFGADLLPMLWPDLSSATRQRVVTIALIAPTHDGSTAVDPTDTYDPLHHPMTPLALHHAQLPVERLMCIFGHEERLSGYSSCPTSHLAKSHLLELDGGHELGGQASFVASKISTFAHDHMRDLAPIGPH